MEARVTILDSNDKICLFEYFSLGEGGIPHTQRIEVPIDAGPVVYDFSEVATGAGLLPKSARVVYSRISSLVFEPSSQARTSTSNTPSNPLGVRCTRKR